MANLFKLNSKIKLFLLFLSAVVLTFGLSLSLQSAAAAVLSTPYRGIQLGSGNPSSYSLGNGENLIWGVANPSGTGSYMLLQNAAYANMFRIDASGNVAAAGNITAAGQNVCRQNGVNCPAVTGSQWTTSGNNIYNNNTGNVGIGVAAPRTKLEVGGDGAVLATGTFGSGWTEPSLGPGARMLWYPRKAAFRAGQVNGTQWNDASIGNSSVAFNQNTTASGQASAAFGNQTTASASQSAAFGTMTTASGLYSAAFGGNTTASGLAATALGNYATASGWNSVASGYYTTAQSYASLVIGRYNIISGTTNSWVATDPVFVIGNGSNAASRSNALTVLKNGNVGIGLANPGEKLEVSGNIKIPSESSYLVGNYNGLSVSGDTLKFGADKFYVNLISGNAGVGFGTPYTKFNVFDTTAVTAFTGWQVGGVRINGGNNYSAGQYALLGFGSGDTGASGRYTKNLAQIGAQFTGGGSSLSFGTSNNYVTGITNTAMTIDPSGNVGIGTAYPGAKLQINPQDSSEGLRIVSAANYSPLNIRNNPNSADIFRVDQSGILQVGSIPWARLTGFPAACGAGQYVSGVGAGLTCSTPPAGGGSQWTSSGSNIYYNAGNVGIGTVSPSQRLTVNGAILASIIVDTGLTAYDGIVYNQDGQLLSSLGLVYSNGNLGVGTAAPAAKLDIVNGVSDTTGMHLKMSNTSNNAYSLNFDRSGTNVQSSFNWQTSGANKWNLGQDNDGTDNLYAYDWVSNRFFMKWVSGSGDVGFGQSYSNLYIQYGGNVGIGTANPTYKLQVNGNAANTTGVWAVASDERLKKDIQPLIGSLDLINRLEGVSFYWRDKNRGDSLQRGFIAQEVEKVLPEWVKIDGNGYKWLEKQGIEAVIVEAIKELSAKFNSLAARIEDLFKKYLNHEERVRALERENLEQKNINQRLERELDSLKYHLENMNNK